MLRSYTYQLDEDEAEELRFGPVDRYITDVRLPAERDNIPATIPRFVRSVMEIQTQWKLFNRSPVTCFEIRRATPGRLRFVYTTPTQRLMRKIKLQLSDEIPGVSFEDGATGLPVSEDETLGCGLLTTGRKDWFPLRTEFDRPLLNNLVSTLHRHAFQDTKIVVQVLFQPVAGRPFRRWWWRRRAIQRRNYLKKEKQRLWGELEPTRREKTQARLVDRKIGNPRFHTTIRFAVIGAGDYTRSRVKELSGAFNAAEHPETGQYLDTVTVSPLRDRKILEFASSIALQRFTGHRLAFHTTPEELGALLALPDCTGQDNITVSQI
ncbi:MAG: hypothetical protein SV186_04095 [Candidatus Nanohaloarchaea archaeon]|nr:hypothetical protein [Candidatus Nanohaloarchaea archaeon]